MNKEDSVFKNLCIVIISPFIYLVLATFTLLFMIYTAFEYIVLLTILVLKYFLIFVYRMMTIKKE